jgi:tRNA (adenine22-N1)-methyltransferase
MQLSKRLQAVADLVTPGSRVADVGCDHAYIPIYLAENKISPHIIALDINQGPIDRAKDNIIKYGCQDRIETKKSDGLEKLNAGEADTILVAGMGGALTIRILTDKSWVLQTVRELVLQPQSEIHKVREMLHQHDYLITGENMVKEDGKYYVMMKAVPQDFMKDVRAYMLLEKEHFYYGRLLLEQRHPVLQEFLLWDLSICQNIMETLERERTDNARVRREELRERIGLIHSGLGYYNR